MAWVYLVLAGLFEIVWAIGLKYAEGFTRPLPTAITIVAMIISMALLGFAARDLPIGTAYAVWTGIGAAGTAIVGMVFLRDPVTTVRLLSILLIVAGVVGLNLSSSSAH